jgi:hypothetical protein
MRSSTRERLAFLGLVAVGLPQHPDEHRPKRPILLAVAQEFGHGSEDDAAGSG